MEKVKKLNIRDHCFKLLDARPNAKPITYEMIKNSPLGRKLSDGQMKDLAKALKDGKISAGELVDIWDRHNTKQDPTGRNTYIGKIAHEFEMLTSKYHPYIFCSASDLLYNRPCIERSKINLLKK